MSDLQVILALMAIEDDHERALAADDALLTIQGRHVVEEAERITATVALATRYGATTRFGCPIPSPSLARLQRKVEKMEARPLPPILIE